MAKTKGRKNKPGAPVERNIARLIVFLLTASLLVLVPLTLAVSVYRIYILPRLAVLLCGAAAVVLSLVLAASRSSRLHEKLPGLFRSNQVRIGFLFLVWISISTAFGVAPLVSLCGSVYNQMGLLTYLCFFACLLGLIAGIGESLARLRRLLWAVAITGLLVAIYAGLQFFGVDPFVPPSIYAFNSESGPVARSVSTLGHYNSLGNFLLYTTPVTAGIALSTRGPRRWVMLAALAISVAGIAFSGTRGAWVGLVAGAATFGASGFLSRQSPKAGIAWGRRTRNLLIVVAVLAVLIAAIASSPASRAIVLRARSFASDGLSGSGRTLLWRDSLRMVRAFPVTGCGPEGFRKAFLAYKSRDLARLSPQANDESSHNAYLDAAISYGLLGLIIYVAMIACALRLLLTARRAAVDPGLRLLVVAILSSFVSVLVHNFFIYDQISTGLYFFAFIALAQVVTNVVGQPSEINGSNVRPAMAPAGARTLGRATFRLLIPHSISELASRARRSAGGRPDEKPRLLPGSGFLMRLATIGAALLLLASLWYSASLLEADAQIREVVDSARALDFDAMVHHGERATAGLEPTGAYDFLFASLLSQYAIGAPDRPQPGGKSLAAIRSTALDLATPHIEKALAHSTAPELDCLVLAYLALAAGDPARSSSWAAEAINWDPNSFEGHWLLAESLIALGDRQRAADQAEAALDLNPSSADARSALSRATGQDQADSQSAAALIERFHGLAKAGKMTKALRILDRAISKSDGKCPDCHSALASFYEETGQQDKAAAERLIALQESRDPPSSVRSQADQQIPVGKTRSPVPP